MLTQSIITILSLIAAILAWIAKLWWSKEYRVAKDAQIDALRSEIDMLRNMTPIKMRQYFDSVKITLEENIDSLKHELSMAHDTIHDMDSKIVELEKLGDDKSEEIIRLKSSRDNIQEALDSFENNNITDFKTIYNGDKLVIKSGKIIDNSVVKLQSALDKYNDSINIKEISDKINTSYEKFYDAAASASTILKDYTVTVENGLVKFIKSHDKDK